MPGSQRQQRVQEQIKEVITEILPLMRDPRVGFVTITGVEVAPDLSIARVYFSVYG
ncbi:MAG: ribosome-binding factor A, partial [Chloroflexi bacterium]|nr:ribosome-binding factor A [Chloroflexota bacterium]